MSPRTGRGKVAVRLDVWEPAPARSWVVRRRSAGAAVLGVRGVVSGAFHVPAGEVEVDVSTGAVRLSGSVIGQVRWITEGSGRPRSE